jgi:hypothetical protein
MDKLRVGLLLDHFNQPIWVHDLIERLKESNCCNIIYVFEPNTLPKKEKGLTHLLKNFRYVIYKGYQIVDRKIFWKKSKNPFIKKELKNLQEVPKKELKVKRTKFSDKIVDEDIKFVKEQNLDIIIRLGFRILKGEILNSARLGIWSYHHADNRVNRGLPAGLWELINEEASTGITLQILSDNLDGGTVLFKGFSKTYPFSFFINKCNYYWKGTFIIPREIEKLNLLGEKAYFNSKTSINPVLPFYDRPLYKKPSNGVMIKFLLKLSLKWILKVFYRIFVETTWSIGYLNQDNNNELRKAKYLIPPHKSLYADPFMLNVQNKNYLFFETQYSNNPGFIQYVSKSSNQENWSAPSTAIKESTHLSFPFIFIWKGNYYMILESSENNEISIYKNMVFPDKWEKIGNLLSGRFVDPVLLFWNNKCWLFVNKAEHQFSPKHDELYLYYSIDIVNDALTPHPMNPIATSPRRSRNAGSIIEENGKLFRPSQDIEYRYGEKINLNEIKELSSSKYEEEVIDTVEPLWSNRINGIHTLQYKKGSMVFDVRYDRFFLKINL